MATNEVVVTLADGQEIVGSGPIVIIGPNGAGKTRLAADLATRNGGDFVSALRSIAVPGRVALRHSEQARNDVNVILTQALQSPWNPREEFEVLLSKLLADDSASAVRFRDEYHSNSAATPEDTTVRRIRRLWSELLPGRSLEFEDYIPFARSDRAGGSRYAASSMSDGERVALYLAARVLDSDKHVIVVDEPEVHFHSRLAVRFWSELEGQRPDVRFVYVTHDLAFALSRQDATYVVVLEDKNPQVVTLAKDLSREVGEALLSAATLSIYARRIVFCEGVETGLDYRLYGAWFSRGETVVVPVESCTNVVNCTKAFDSSTLVAGVTAIGIIDRDYWPEQYISSLGSTITALRVHEVENLLCLSGVFGALVAYLRRGDANSLYGTFLTRARGRFNVSLRNYQISERFKRRCLGQFQQSINSLSASGDLDVMKQTHIQGADSHSWQVPPNDIMREEENVILHAIQGDESEFLMYLPGKVFLRDAVDILGVTKEVYVDLVCNALRAPVGDALYTTGLAIAQAMAPYLPGRSV